MTNYPDLNRFILDNAPAGLNEPSLAMSRRFQLGECLPLYLHFEKVLWQGCGGEVDVYINLDLNRSSVHIDEEGREVGAVTGKVRINYPTHGSVDPRLAAARGLYIAQVGLFAVGLQEFLNGPFLVVLHTAEELAKQAEFQKARKLEIEVKDAVGDSHRGLSVGATRGRRGYRSTLPPGEYPFAWNDRTYKVEVDELQQQRITRLT